MVLIGVGILMLMILARTMFFQRIRAGTFLTVPFQYVRCLDLF